MAVPQRARCEVVDKAGEEATEALRASSGSMPTLEPGDSSDDKEDG